MTKKPIIMICWGPCYETQFGAPGMMLTKAYDWAIAANGGIPMIPLDQKCIADYVAMADGLLLPGAMSYASRPGHDPFADFDAQSRKESFEGELFRAFRDAGKPVLGICNGHQKINCEQGGYLGVDLSATYGVMHMMSAHNIHTEEGSLLRELWGDDVTINSYHNFYVDKVGDGLKITSRSIPEGIPEALEHESLPIYGLQFHPERMRGDNVFPAEGPDGDLVFRFFINKCIEVRDAKA